MAKNRVAVTVGGREITMLTDETPEYILRVADYVDRQMTELNMTHRLSSAMLGTMAALNTADELLRAQDEIARLRADAAKDKQRLAELQNENTSIKERLRGALDDLNRRTSK